MRKLEQTDKRIKVQKCSLSLSIFSCAPLLQKTAHFSCKERNLSFISYCHTCLYLKYCSCHLPQSKSEINQLTLIHLKFKNNCNGNSLQKPLSIRKSFTKKER